MSPSKIAFVNHSPIRLPNHDRPLDSISIGIWCYEMATRLTDGGEWEAVVYHQDKSLLDSEEELHRGVVFKSFPVGLDERFQRFLARIRRWERAIGFPGDPKRPLFGSNWFHPSYIRGVAKDIRARDCDVVHVSNFSQFVPVIRRAQPRAKIVLHMQCEWLTQLDESTIARRLEHCDLISGCSQFITEGIQKRFPKHAHKCFTLYNGVNLESFSPGDGAAREREILYVGRFSPEKGIHVLLEAFAEVAKNNPGTKLRLIGGSVPAPYEFIVAISDDPLVEQLEGFYRGPEPYAKALENGLDPELRDRVTFEAPLPQAELASAYRRAEVFVFPSVWHEPFGMPVIEAMAFGIPVVSTRGGGIPEFMPDGEAGLLVTRGSSEELANALSDLLNDAARRDRMGATGRARIEAAFSWDHIAAQLDSHLRRITVPN